MENAKEEMERVVQECVDEGILEDYLKRKGDKVVEILMAEYDYEMDMAAQRKEAAEQAKVEAYYNEMHLPVSEIARKVGISEESVEGILSEEGLISKSR